MASTVGVSAKGFMDVNFGGDVDKWWSMIDFIFSLFRGFILWRSCLQPIMVLSTTEVEYIGITEAAKKALWLKDLALEIEFPQDAVRMH